jgi:HD-like signal output (HDOD) protein
VAANLEARVNLLEQAIVRDVALTGKVLRIASSALNGSGSQITSVKQTIMLLGYERVQHLSTATSVFEQIEQHAPEVQDLLVLSVLTGNQSLCLATELGYARPELAYLCGLFRGLGEVLVACYRARQYKEWLTSVREGAPGTPGAESRIFGFTFDQVGIAMARQWGMPEELIASMGRAPRVSGPVDDPLHQLVQFSADFTRLTHGAPSTPPSPEAVEELVARGTRTLGIDREAVQGAQLQARQEAKPTLEAMQVSLDAWLAARSASATAPEATVADEPEASAADAHESLLALAARSEPVATDSIEEAAVRAALLAVTAQRLAGELSGIGMATYATLEAMRSAGYEHALLALSTEDFTMVRGRMGAGPGHEELVRSFLVRPAFGPLGTALEQRTTLFIDLEADEGKPFRRERLIHDRRARSFALLPLVLDGKLLGCLYVDSTARPVAPSDTLRELLCGMRDYLADVFARNRSGRDASAS